MSRGWLIVFAKAPRPGLVKTRLSPPLSLDQAAEFYKSMLADVLDSTARFASEFDLYPILAFHPPDAATEMVPLTPAGYRLHVQQGVDLAGRMANAFAEAVAAGSRSVLLRGSDSPALNAAHIASALEQLEAGADLVFTPDQGGGYALVGMQKPHAEIFDIPMSTSEMLEKTIAVAKKRGLRVGMTEPVFDVDVIDDLSAFEALSEEQSSSLCPRTVHAITHMRSVGVL